MAVRAICVVPHPILRQRARRVKNIDGSIQSLIEDMVETMRAASGVGLAANQVGIPLRVIVIEVPGEEVRIMINPEMVRRTGERVVMEGCLSLPDYRGEIKRSARVVVKGRDRQGKELRIKAEELLAQALEHEIDHLNGVLYIDRLENESKLFKLEPEKETGAEI